MLPPRFPGNPLVLKMAPPPFPAPFETTSSYGDILIVILYADRVLMTTRSTLRFRFGDSFHQIRGVHVNTWFFFPTSPDSEYLLPHVPPLSGTISPASSELVSRYRSSPESRGLDSSVPISL